MPKVCNLCIRLVWLCHHKMVMMLQKQHIPFWLGDQIAILCTFLSRNDLRTLLVAKKRFTHFVRKVFARWILPSGKFRLFGPLDRERSKTVATSNNRGSHQRITMKSKDIGALTVNNTWSSSGLKVFPKLTQVAPLWPLIIMWSSNHSQVFTK